MNEEPKPTTRSRRQWSEQDKLRLLEESASSNVSEVARRNQLSTSQIFQWRRQIQPRNPYPIESINESGMASELAEALTRNNRKIKLLDEITERINVDIIDGKLTTYNAATAHSCLVKASTSLQSQRLELLDRLARASAAMEPDLNRDPKTDLAIELEAERICYQLVKQQVEEKRAAEIAYVC